jgi:hypothetical protein
MHGRFTADAVLLGDLDDAPVLTTGALAMLART